MQIEDLVETLNFNDFDDDMFAEIFTKEQIIKDFSFEGAIANPLEILPADYLWYLEPYGTLHNFFKIKIKSTVNGLSRKETFILYKDPNTQKLSFVKRLSIEKEDLKLNGIGVFKFDYIWSSKRKKEIEWAEIPATIYLTKSEDDFTDTYLDFVKKTLQDASFKEKLEQFIFERYQTIDYPEFLAQDEQTREELEPMHPAIESPEETWQLLGEAFDIHFTDEQTIDIRFGYGPDPEHGLTVCIKNNVLE